MHFATNGTGSNGNCHGKSKSWTLPNNKYYFPWNVDLNVKSRTLKLLGKEIISLWPEGKQRWNRTKNQQHKRKCYK